VEHHTPTVLAVIPNDAAAAPEPRSSGPVPQRPSVAIIWPDMDIPERVEAYLASQPEPKQTDLRQLHAQVLAELPDCRLWFNDGTNEDGKVVANPNIGYGVYTITYADRSSREFYRIGLSVGSTNLGLQRADHSRESKRFPRKSSSANLGTRPLAQRVKVHGWLPRLISRMRSTPAPA
jgi:hypothetical protein